MLKLWTRYVLLAVLVVTTMHPLPVAAQAPGTLHPDLRGEAMLGVQTLQTWYVADTGLYQTTGWWNSANAVTVLVDAMRVSESREYLPVLANTLQKAQGKYAGFLNDYYDDEGWWALAWIDAYDLTHDPQYLTMASSIFADMAKGWDDTCNGGIWWSKDKTYKNAIANELFLSVAAHLARRSDDAAQRAQYTAWAQREWDWFRQTGMINADNLVNDGLDLKTCKTNLKNTWTYNQGVVLGGLVELNRVQADGRLRKTANAIAQAALAHLTDAGGVMHDICEPKCSEDGVQFKGIFVRNLMLLEDTSPNRRYRKFIEANAKSLLDTSQGASHQFGQVWSGPFDGSNAGIQSSALDLLVAAAAIEHAGNQHVGTQ